MAVRYIVKYGHPTLRMKAKAIDVVDDTIRALAEDMVETMYEAEGIGLAAPQVAEPLALCVVNCGMIDEGTAARVYVNPVLSEEEGSTKMEEGCLSIPDIREDVERPESIRVRYQDLNGVEHEERCEGLLARVLQHEIDHLNGVLFVDRISPMKRKLLSKKLKQIAVAGKTEMQRV